MHSCCCCDNKNKIIHFYQHLYLNQEAEMTYKFKVKLVDISRRRKRWWMLLCYLVFLALLRAECDAKSNQSVWFSNASLYKNWNSFLRESLSVYAWMGAYCMFMFLFIFTRCNGLYAPSRAWGWIPAAATSPVLPLTPAPHDTLTSSCHHKNTPFLFVDPHILRPLAAHSARSSTSTACKD